MNQLSKIFIKLTNAAYHQQRSENVIKRGYTFDNGKALDIRSHDGANNDSCTRHNKVDEDKTRQNYCAEERVCRP